MTETVAAVVVTFNRADLLQRMLEGVAAMTVRPDVVYVVDNASADHTGEVLTRWTEDPRLHVHPIRSTENLGGSGGFNLGMRTAYDAGWDRIWLMDDDIVPAADCLAVMLAHDGPCLSAVREDTTGQLVERAAVSYDMRNPLAINPKRTSVDRVWHRRRDMPAETPIENVSFEGYMVRREVVTDIGFPDPSFFVFYEDVDYALRAREAGFPLTALRDAVIVRQLPFDQVTALATWKGFYMYRNMFVVHFRHGQNLAVRWKPYLITAGVIVLAPRRGGRREASNVLRALSSARRMRAPRPEALPPSG